MHNIFSYAIAKLNLCLFVWNVGKLDRIKIEHCIFRILFKLFFLSLFEINFNQRERNENFRNNSKRKKKENPYITKDVLQIQLPSPMIKTYLINKVFILLLKNFNKNIKYCL